MAQEKRSKTGMDELISALLDDELQGTARERALARVMADADLRDAWSRQHLMRAVLAGKSRCLPDAGFADRVMAAIHAGEDRPRTVVTPLRRPAKVQRWAMGGLAMAASVMGVMLLLRVMPVDGPVPQPTTVAAAVEQDAPETLPVAGDAQFQREMEEYLLEHQRLAARHGLAAPRGYMRVVTPGFTHVSYSGE